MDKLIEVHLRMFLEQLERLGLTVSTVAVITDEGTYLVIRGDPDES